jgi:hypothetical protein
MLIYKAWRETRGRFALAAAALAGLCVLLLVFEAELRRRMGEVHGAVATYDGYVYSRIYAGVVRVGFVLFAGVLGLGGLARERAHGTLGFTLALPVPRARHVVARAAVGLGELVALAGLVAILVPACSAIAGEAYPWRQALGFAGLWLVVGALVFAASLVVSVLVHGELAALAVVVVAPRLMAVVVARTPGLDRLPLGFDSVMSGRGMGYLDAHTGLLVGPVPWLALAVVAMVAAALIWIAARITAQEKF